MHLRSVGPQSVEYAKGLQFPKRPRKKNVCNAKEEENNKNEILSGDQEGSPIDQFPTMLHSPLGLKPPKHKS